MLTKNNFPLTYLFLYFQMRKNMKNYIYTRFPSKQMELTFVFKYNFYNFFFWQKKSHLVK